MSARVVLVVEDNAELRHVLKEALSAEGHTVLTARDEAEALDVLRENRVDLFISDLSDDAPSRDGFEALREEFPNLPVVALASESGHHPNLFFTVWQEPKGGLRTISKPFRLGELLAVSREVLGAG
jgi:CheY-like chemotaxis protein